MGSTSRLAEVERIMIHAECVHCFKSTSLRCAVNFVIVSVTTVGRNWANYYWERE
jgi:hypothetical protein